MESCPVCYERFSDDNPNTVPRKLSNCADIICTSCIQGEIFDDSFYCPECGCEYHGSTVDDFSKPCSSKDLVINKIEDGQEHDFSADSGSATPEFSESRSASVDLADFDHAFHTVSPRRVSAPRTVCNEPGCRNKAIASEFCLKHARNIAGTKNMLKASIVKSEQIVKELMESSHDLRHFSTSGNSLKPLASHSSIDDPTVLVEKFREQQTIELGEAMDLILRAKSIMAREPNILKLDAPLVVCGDIHGQYFDLLNLFEEAKQQSGHDDNVFLFLGDYVDRGYYSCEVILYLIALKVARPDKVFLLRGNHECASVSGHFGFKEECKMKYGINLYYSFLLLFQTMPLAAVISTAFGDIFACHGGLSPHLQTLDDIEAIDRMIEPEGNLALMDILWADPIPDDDIENMTTEEYIQFSEIDWKPNPARGCSYCYGYKAIKTFLDTNNLVCMVRAHEVQEDGYRGHFDPAVMEAKIKAVNRSLVRLSPGDSKFEMGVSMNSIASCSVDSFGGDDVKQITGDELFQSTKINKTDLGIAEVQQPSGAIKSEKLEDFPPVITIFSAPNYCDRYQNKAAILFIDAALDNFRVIQYDCVPHPKPENIESQQSNLLTTIINTCPYMPTSFRNFVRLAVELGDDELFVDGGTDDGQDEYTSIDNNSMEETDGTLSHRSSDISEDPLPLPQPTSSIVTDKDTKTAGAEDFSGERGTPTTTVTNESSTPSEDRESSSSSSAGPTRRVSFVQSSSAATAAIEELSVKAAADNADIENADVPFSPEQQHWNRLDSMSPSFAEVVKSSGSSAAAGRNGTIDLLMETPSPDSRIAPNHADSISTGGISSSDSGSDSGSGSATLNNLGRSISDPLPSGHGMDSLNERDHSEHKKEGGERRPSLANRLFGVIEEEEEEDTVEPLQPPVSATVSLSPRLSDKNSSGKIEDPVVRSMPFSQGMIKLPDETVSTTPKRRSLRKAASVCMAHDGAIISATAFGSAAGSTSTSTPIVRRQLKHAQSMRNTCDNNDKKRFPRKEKTDGSRSISLVRRHSFDKELDAFRDSLDALHKESFDKEELMHLVGDHLHHANSGSKFLDVHRSHSPIVGNGAVDIRGGGGGGGGVVEGLPPIPGSTKQVRHHSMFVDPVTGAPGSLIPSKGESLRRKKSQIYMQMMASDSVNEVHPEKLTDFFKTNFKNMYEEGVTKKEYEQKLFKLASAEKPAVSVSDLKSRFEKKNKPKADELIPDLTERKRTSVVSTTEKPAAATILGLSEINYNLTDLMNKFGGSKGISVRSFSGGNKEQLSSGSHHHRKSESVDTLKWSPRHKDNTSSIATKRVMTLVTTDSTAPSSFSSDSSLSVVADEMSSATASPRRDIAEKVDVTGKRPNTVKDDDDDNDGKLLAAGKGDPLSQSSSLLNEAPPADGLPSSALETITSDSVLTNSSSSAASTASDSLIPNVGPSNLSASTPTTAAGSSPGNIVRQASTGLKRLYKASSIDVMQSSTAAASANVLSSTSSTDYNSDEGTASSRSEGRESISLRLRSVSQDGLGDYDNKDKRRHSDAVSDTSETNSNVGLEDAVNADGEVVVFSKSELMGLRLMFSLFDRAGSNFIEYEDLVAYAEETGDMTGIRDAANALEILDIDGDGKIGLLDFIHFARRLKKIHQSSKEISSESEEQQQQQLSSNLLVEIETTDDDSS